MPTQTQQQVMTFLDGHADELVTLCRDAVRTPSENPPGDEGEIAQLFERAACSFGLKDVKIEEPVVGRPNLLARIPGTEPGQTLLFVSHLDTKRVGDRSRWTVPPLEGCIQNGRLYGRGACDAKSCCTAMLGAAWAMAACSARFAGELVLVFAADEEAGSQLGVGALLECGLSGDAAVVGEPAGIRSGFDWLHVAGRGNYNFRFDVRGNQSHSGLSAVLNPVNANIKAAELLLKLKNEFRVSFRPHPAFPDGPTLNPGLVLEGGVFVGVIPGEASFTSDIRIIPGMKHEDVRAELLAFLAQAVAEDPDLDAEFVEGPRPLGWSPGYEINVDHPLVQAAQDAGAAVLGRDVPLGGYPATTDARLLTDAGIPSLPALGPGLISHAHGPDEYQDLEELVQGAKIYALTALSYLDPATPNRR